MFDWTRAVRDDPRLSANARHVALTLATYMAADGVAWPSVATLARAIGRSERTVERCVPELEATGHLAVERSVGRGNFNPYRALERASERRRFEAKKATAATRKGDNGDAKRRQPDGGSSKEVIREGRGGAMNGAAPLIDEDCMSCGRRLPCVDADGAVVCVGCAGLEVLR